MRGFEVGDLMGRVDAELELADYGMLEDDDIELLGPTEEDNED